MNESKTLSPTKLNTLVKKITQHHAACLMAFGDALRHAFECGRLLNEAKGTLARGEFEKWVHKNFDFSDRTAQLYKRVFENWPVLKGKVKDMASLSLSQANRLLNAPKTKPASDADTSAPTSVLPSGDDGPGREGPLTPPVNKPTDQTVNKPVKKESKPHDTLQGLMKKYDLFGEPEMLIELLLALGFAKSDIEAKLEQG